MSDPAHGRTGERLARARGLVMRHGWNATAYQILNPGFTLWFSEDGGAAVGYVDAGGVRMAAGDPVCPWERTAEVCAAFEAEAARAGRGVCYFAASPRFAERAEDGRYARVLLGAQPVWDPHGWPEIIRGHASLRAQLNRARNKEVRVAEWPRDRAAGSPVLHRRLEEWLEGRGLPPLHFLVEPETLDRLFDRRVFVAEREGTPIGFLVASPVPARRGWLVEQFVRGRGAPNGTTELMIDGAMRAVATGGAEYVTLGLAPLSRHAPEVEADEPLWLRAVLGWVRAHGRRFYNFGGLDAFKAKLDPHRWEPVFALSREESFSPRTLHAIAAAFAREPVAALLARAGWRALRQEARWLGERVAALRS